MKCRICDNADANQPYVVKEMQFGYRDEFNYFQCANCGCLQIAEIPSDMTKYYPSNYYSYSIKLTDLKKSKNKFIQSLKNARNDYAIFNKGILGRLIYSIMPCEWAKEYMPLYFPGMLPKNIFTKKSRILDVGCGNGYLVYRLKDLNFENVLGIDPYCKESVVYPNGAEVLKKSIHELEGAFDLVMFHHSFEHISDPLATLQAVSTLLPEDGKCLIRIPTVDSYAWKHYRTNWMALDAPRHFYLHSIKSITILADRVGFELTQVVYDSNEQQFYASEQYINDIPFMSDASYAINKQNSMFTESTIKSFKERADSLNKQKQGDCAAFYLQKR